MCIKIDFVEYSENYNICCTLREVEVRPIDRNVVNFVSFSRMISLSSNTEQGVPSLYLASSGLNKKNRPCTMVRQVCCLITQTLSHNWLPAYTGCRWAFLLQRAHLLHAGWDSTGCLPVKGRVGQNIYKKSLCNTRFKVCIILEIWVRQDHLFQTVNAVLNHSLLYFPRPVNFQQQIKLTCVFQIFAWFNEYELNGGKTGTFDQ